MTRRTWIETGLLFCFGLSLLAAESTALVRYQGSAASLNERWQWALKETNGQQTAWVGYEVPIPMHEGILILGGGSWISGTFTNRGISLESRLAGYTTDSPPPKKDRPMAVLIKLDRGKPAKLIFTPLTWPVKLDGQSLLWLGNATAPESLDRLLAAYRDAKDDELARDLVETVGFHDFPQATAFLKEIAGGKGAAELRGEAVEALRNQSHPDAARTIMELAKNEKDLEVREEAVETLSQIDSPEAFALLLRLAKEKGPSTIREAAIDQLGEDGSEEGLKLLRELLAKERDSELLEEIVSALAEHPSEFALIAETARSHRYPEVRREAVHTLGEMDPTRAMPILEKIVAEERDEEIAQSAVEALNELPPGTATPLLLKIAESHPFSSVRCAAVEVLGESKQPGMLQTLKKIAYEDKNEDVQRTAVSAIADNFGREGLKLVLAIAKNHPNPEVREEALDLLKDHTEER